MQYLSGDEKYTDVYMNINTVETFGLDIES